MSKLAPLLLLGGAAALIATRKKSSPKETVVPEEEVIPETKPSNQKKTWEDRQQALAYLAELGVCTTCDPGAVDGIYGTNTKNGIMGFQHYAGIKVTGKWDRDTEAAMRAALQDPYGMPGAPQKPGDEHFSPITQSSQITLKLLGYKPDLDGMLPLQPNSILAIQKFQSDNGLLPTGVFDLSTMEQVKKDIQVIKFVHPDLIGKEPADVFSEVGYYITYAGAQTAAETSISEISKQVQAQASEEAKSLSDLIEGYLQGEGKYLVAPAVFLLKHLPKGN